MSGAPRTDAALLPAARVLLGLNPSSAEAMDALGCGGVGIDHLRYKPGRSVIARIGGPHSGRWIAGFSPAATDKAAKLRRKARALGRVLFEAEVPGAPGHVLMTGPVGLDNRLRSGLGAEGLLRGDGAPGGTVLNYNPWRRLVLEVRGTSATPQGDPARPSDAARLVSKTAVRPPEALPGLLGELRSRGVPVLVARPGADARTLYYPHYGEGDLGAEWSLPNSHAAAEHAAAAGRILAGLHSSGVRPAGTVDPRRHLLAAARGVADVLPGAAGLARETAEDLLGAVDAVRAGLVPLHGDFSADQLLAGPDGLRLIDLDRTAMGPAGWDLGCFAATELLAGRGSTHVATLRDAYGEARGGTPDVDPWTAVHVMMRSLEPFREARAGWEDLVVERLRLAAQTAGGGAP